MAIRVANNQSLTAITALPSAISVGAMTLLETQTASSSATISFTSNINDTYKEYLFKWINCHPSQQSGDGEEFQFNFSVDTGSNYNVSKTSTYFVATHAEDDSSTSSVYSASHDHANGTGFQNISVDMDADNDASTSGQMQLFNPSSTTFVKHFIAQSNYMHSSPLSINSFVGGYCNTTSAVDAVRFQFSAGNIDAGVIKLYGIS